ncbi:hypothetical protein Tco_1028052 [Tanacetum coccineum]
MRLRSALAKERERADSVWRRIGYIQDELRQIRSTRYYDMIDVRRTTTITRSGMTPEAIEEMITRRVAEALAKQEANHNLGPIFESESENADDNKNRNGGGRRNGNRGRGNGGNGNGNSGRNENNNNGNGDQGVTRVELEVLPVSVPTKSS